MTQRFPCRYFKTNPEIIQLAVIMYVRSSKWRWHLDEISAKTNGQTHDLWRAVDHGGEVLESYVTKKRDKTAALKFIRKSMRRHGPPRVLATDMLRSYGAALKKMGPHICKRRGRI